MNTRTLKKMKPSQVVELINSQGKAIEELTSDRNKYRKFIQEELKNQLQLMTENKYNPPKNIVERLVATISSVKPYYIWW